MSWWNPFGGAPEPPVPGVPVGFAVNQGPPPPYGAAPTVHYPTAYGAAPPAYGPPAHAPVPHAAPAPPAAPGNVTKKALLIGINYLRTPECRLSGCINDVNCMKYLLMTKYKYEERNILCMTDDQSDPLKQPTRHNIVQGMRWLVMGTKANDTLFFQFSGHGSQVRDHSGDEADGMDETILPCDFKQAGQITDDEIYQLLCRPLPYGVRLTAVMDCCHSGTGFDLPYTHSLNFFGQLSTTTEPMQPNWCCQGACVLISGCMDSQTSADTSALAGGVSTGACSFSLIKAIETSFAQKTTLTYGQLVVSMLNVLRSAPQKYKQTPQLSSTWPCLNDPIII
eukprot:tig00020675_g12670.t1